MPKMAVSGFPKRKTLTAVRARGKTAKYNTVAVHNAAGRGRKGRKTAAPVFSRSVGGGKPPLCAVRHKCPAGRTNTRKGV